MLYTSAFERDLWNRFLMSSSPLSPCFTLQTLIFFVFLSSISEANNHAKPNQSAFPESTPPRLSNATFGIGFPCLVRR